MWVVFADNYTPSSPEALIDVSVAKLDGSAPPLKIASSSALSDPGIYPDPRFVSRWAGSRLVVGTASPATGTMELASFDPAAGFAKTDLGSSIRQFATTPASNRVAVLASNGALTTMPVGGGVATPIDTGVAAVTMLADGNTLLYGTTSGSLKRAGADGATPAVIFSTGYSAQFVWVDGDARGLDGSSPDGKSAFVGGLTQQAVVYLPTASAQRIDRLSANANFTADIFTADSAFVLFQRATTKALAAQPTLGGNPIDIDPTESTGIQARALSGSRILYATSDAIRAVDVTSATQSTLVVRPFTATFFVTAARDRVVYTKDVGSGEVWVTEIPK